MKRGDDLTFVQQFAFGTHRIDYYWKAAEDLEAADMVKLVKSPKHGVRKCRLRDGKPFIGATVHAAKRGEGVWVRVYGPATIKHEGTR